MTSEALRFTFNHLLKQWVAWVKERKKEIQKFEYLKIEKSFLDKVKGIVHNFLRAIVWQKKDRSLLHICPLFLYFSTKKCVECLLPTCYCLGPTKKT